MNGWTYGYWWAETDGDGTYDAATDFLAMASFSGLWRPPDYDPNTASPNYTWCYLAAWGGHPGSPPKKFPIRRWTSPLAGAATLVAHIDKADTSGGDGTRAIVFVDGTEVWRQAVAGTDGVGVTRNIPVVLHAGSVVDYMLDPLDNDGMDTTNEQLTITGP